MLTATGIVVAVEAAGLKIDSWSGNSGKFRDLAIGTGAKWLDLQKLRKVIVNGVGENLTGIAHVDNVDHPDHGLFFLHVGSVWWDVD